MASKILLINPPYTLEENFLKLAKVSSLVQPLGLGYLAAVLENAGKTVKILDSPTLKYTITDILDEVKKFKPDIVGITSTINDHYKAEILAQKIKKKYNSKIILGGPHITSIPESFLNSNNFDFCVLGEGELTTLELVDAIEKNAPDFKNIKGIMYKSKRKAIKTEPRPFIGNLDDVPFPARHLLPKLSNYHPSPATYKKLPVGTIISSRGCPFQCIFCSKTIFGNNFRFRSAKNVVDEMEILVNDYNAREIRFWDDTFNANPERVIEICKEIIRRKLDIPWTCLARVNFIDKKTLRWMKKAGCWQLSFGIESGNEQVLRIIKKGLTKEMVKKALNLCKKYGIETRGFFILGLPGDDEKSMRDTIDFAKSLPLDNVNFNSLIPFPGTELWEIMKKYGEFDLKMSFKKYKPTMAKEYAFIPFGLKKNILKRYIKKAYKEFYMRPSYIIGQVGKIRSVPDLVNKIIAFFVVRKI